ncbi:exodeoxyribonuclease V subunit alpha [Umboniibacter marinipuniceus]|uniref:RecBCD enzyme subunit RecD n=1 Tax=Umboniibacter marinipuniceus TaxID=569599 RepID=A0A3M0AI38_9GAMM|nr:exodeoxyribonuclease V subunit alpha [Umboniibacter marinipuniceus]RMA78892.1 DNA helicase/exodeoxyribonuclease V alpha subunit [Umboniibacter marinipuniceus]
MPKPISYLDKKLGRYLGQFAAAPHQRLLQQIGMLLSAVRSQGHSCLPLSVLDEVAGAFELELIENWREQWRLLLDSEPNLVGTGSGSQPLQYRDGKLYFQRDDHAEDQISKRLIQHANGSRLYAERDLESALDRLFQGSDTGTLGQRQAALAAASNPLAMILGGPGTGKTTTVVKLLAVILEQALALKPLYNILLLAPTGKAAARLGQSIKAQRNGLDVSEAIRAAIPSSAKTLHRALEWRGGSFSRNARNPLVADLIVVDEASMIDTRLMLGLVEAVPKHCQLLLLGDAHQLASVEAGSVLSDLELAAKDPSSLLHSGYTKLTHSYRFNQDSGIGALASAINLGNTADIARIFDTFSDELTWSETLDSEALSQPYYKYLAAIEDGAAPEQIYAYYNEWRVLCAVREGEFGLSGLNALIEIALAAKFNLDIESRFYSGLPVMITQNDYLQELFNGDIGLILEVDGELRAFFEAEDGTMKSLLAARLPHVEKAFAMTVHKSQGSEFNECALVLPERARRETISRELIYTAITRAKKAFKLMGSEVTLLDGVTTSTQRFSGLASRLIRSEV